MITSKQIQDTITTSKELLLKNAIQIGILIVLVIIVSLFFRQGRGLQYSYQVDDIARDPVIAPFNFPILKTEEKLEADLDKALRSEPYLFQRNQEVVSEQMNALNEYFLLAGEIRSAAEQLEKTKNFFTDIATMKNMKKYAHCFGQIVQLLSFFKINTNWIIRLS